MVGGRLCVVVERGEQVRVSERKRGRREREDGEWVNNVNGERHTHTECTKQRTNAAHKTM